MNIREKLLELGIYVPEAAHGYRTGKGRLIWLLEEGDEAAALFEMPITREQYEGMMMAGLIGDRGWHVAHPYSAPLAVE